ncbi:MAG: DUF177 domain-containing protein, partial [bacterium]
RHRTSLIFSREEIKEKNGLSAKIRPDPSFLKACLEPQAHVLEILVEADFSIGSDSILAEGSASGVWEMKCARCAAVCRASFSAAFDETYPETVELIDLSEVIRQAVLLTLPLKQLCSEKCKGLCQVCGENFNDGTCSCSTQMPGPFSALKDFKIKEQR